jgi:hypothetical protein
MVLTGAGIDLLVIQSPMAIVSSLPARTAPMWVKAVTRSRTGAGMAPPTVMAPRGTQLSRIAVGKASGIEDQCVVYGGCARLFIDAPRQIQQ